MARRSVTKPKIRFYPKMAIAPTWTWKFWANIGEVNGEYAYYDPRVKKVRATWKPNPQNARKNNHKSEILPNSINITQLPHPKVSKARGADEKQKKAFEALRKKSEEIGTFF